jgi:hypothetical protein
MPRFFRFGPSFLTLAALIAGGPACEEKDAPAERSPRA